MATTDKPALADSTNAPPPPAANSPPRPAADKPPRAVVTWYHPDQLPPPPAAELLRPAPPAAAPKEPSSAFVFFGRATREDIKAAHPDWSLGDVGRELSARWKALDDAAKKPFHELAAADKERYEREKAAYEAYEAANPPPPVVAENVPSNEAPAPRNPPKRKAPPTKEVPLPETEDWKPENDGVRIVNAWTGEPVKAPRAKKVYCSDDDSEIEDDDEPKMKKQSGYLYHCAQNREAAKAAVEAAQPDLSKGEKTRATTRELGAMWSALDDKAKQKCRDDAPMVAVKPKKKKTAKVEPKKQSGTATNNRNFGLDKTGRPNPHVGVAWGGGADPPKWVQCLEGKPHKPGPAVDGAEELVVDALPQACLSYPDYKKGRGSNIFRKTRPFYKKNGYHKIKVYKAGGYGRGGQPVFKFFKEVKRARA